MHSRPKETRRAESCPRTADAFTVLADAPQVVSRAPDGTDDDSPLDELVRAASAQVPGATAASVTMLRHGRFSTVASTGAVAPPARTRDERPSSLAPTTSSAASAACDAPARAADPVATGVRSSTCSIADSRPVRA